jgi:hypothetical protein
MTYELFFSDNDEPVNEAIFDSLDLARDVAFDISLETSAELYIVETFGAARNTVERVMA